MMPMASMRGLVGRAGMAVLAWLAASDAAQAQGVREFFQGQARSSNYASGFQALSIFGGTPGISAATYNSDEMDLDSFKLPISHTFAPFEGRMFGGVAPHVELTLSYLRARQNLYLGSSPVIPNYANLRFHSYTGLAGAGFDIPLATRTWLRPVLLAGYSRVESDTNFLGPNSEFFEEQTQGILNDVRIDSILSGAALALVHEQDVAPDTTLFASLRYNRIIDVNYSASDKALESTNRFSVTTASAELRGPMGVEVMGRSLRWIAFTGGTWMMGRHRNALGFSSFAELGGGIELADHTLLRGVEGISLRTSALVGERVTGWSLSLSLSF